MDDKIPGLEKSLSMQRISWRGADVHNAEDTAVYQPCANAKKRLAVDSRKQKACLPKNPDRPLRPHSNLGPGKGKGNDGRTEGQKQHSAELLFLGEAVHSAGKVTSDGG